ncbi:MAG: propionyl-CoA carboxylase [Proteobacteria bacterium]|nr:propionyl-CoA carboxylase [Pseudomonadota bacterium]
MSWEKEVEEIKKRRKLARQQGGEESIAKHHARGKLSIRERIDALLDENTFQEHGQMTGAAALDDDGELETFTPANYVVGLGKINKKPVAVGGEDFTLKGGSPNASGLRKSIYAEHLALQYRIPLVRMLEGGGGSVAGGGGNDPKKPRTVGNPVYDPPRFKIIADAMAHVPIASAALGPVAGFPAARLALSHFSIMAKETSQVMIGGPALVERALNQDLTKDELGGAHIHTRSGIVDNLAENEYDAFRQIRTFLSYLPPNVWEIPERIRCQDPVDRQEEALLSIVPRDRKETYDMRRLIRLVVDRDSFFEICPFYGLDQVVGLARISGQSVGIIGNDCTHYAGALSAQGSQKLRRLVELCDTFHLPVVNFVDEPGFMIGPEAEQTATIRYGMAAISSVVHASVPWSTVMVRKAFGVASAAHFGQNAYVLAWPSIETGALPLEGGVAVAFRRQIAEAPDPEAKRKELEEMLDKNRSPYPPAESFAFHEMIDPRETRPMLCDWVEWIQPAMETLKGPVRFAIRP